MAEPTNGITRLNVRFMNPIEEKDEENQDPEWIAIENDRLMGIAHRIFAEKGTITAWEIFTTGKVAMPKAIEILRKFNQHLILEKLAREKLTVRENK